MLMQNRDINAINTCCYEILDAKAAKMEINDSDKLVWNIARNLSTLKPIIKELSQQEMDLRNDTILAIRENESNKDKLNEKFSKALNAMLDEEHDVSLLKLTHEHFKVLQKYLSGSSTMIMFEFLMPEEKDNVEKLPKKENKKA